MSLGKKNINFFYVIKKYDFNLYKLLVNSLLLLLLFYNVE
jgi:hypothetical protein